MSFLKRGRKKERSHKGTPADVVAPVPVQPSPGFIQVPDQPTGSLTEPVTARRISQVSASSPDIYHEFEPISSLTDTVLHGQPVPQRVSTPTKPKYYKKKKGIASIFSRKKSSSLPHLPSPQGLPPLPHDAPDRVRYQQQLPVDASLHYADLHYQKDHYTAVRDITPVQGRDETYPLYSTVRIDPASGSKVTVRNIAVNTPRRSSEIGISPAPGETEREVSRDMSGVIYENEVSLRVPREGERSSVSQASRDVSTKGEHSVIENTLQLLMKQQHLLEMNMKLQQEQLHKVTGDKDLSHSAQEDRTIEDKQTKRQSRITEPTDTDPTTYSLNQSSDIPNNALPSNRLDRIQYYFVPGVEGNGYLRPVGPDGRPPSRHFAQFPPPEHKRDDTPSRPLSSEQLITYLQERQVEIESKLVDLTEQNAQLVAQINVLYQNPASTNSPEEAASDVTHEMAYLRQECERLRELTRDCKQQVGTPAAADVKCRECMRREKELNELKRIVYRLNVELSRYQSLYGDCPLSDTPLPLEQLGVDNTPWLCNTSFLSPLLTAYDEQLNERNTLLRELQGSVVELQSVRHELEDRNADVCRELASRPVSDEMDRCKQQLQLVKEENVVLSGDLHSTKQELFQLKARVKHELNQTDERLHTFEREAEKYKTCKASFKSKLESERKCYNDKITSLREQLTQSESQTNKLHSKLREVSSFVSKKDSELAEHKATISVLEGKSSAAINSVRALKQKASLLEREIEVSRSNELTAKSYLEEVVSLVERTAMERDTYAKLAGKHETLSQGKDRNGGSLRTRFDRLRDTTQNQFTDFKSVDTPDPSEMQSAGDEVLQLKSLVGELQREIVDLKGARNTADLKLDSILLSLPKQHTTTYSM